MWLRIVMRPSNCVFLIALFSLISCTFSPAPKGFYFQPSDQQKMQFLGYDFDRQYAIYIFGMQNVEPPVLDLAWVLAGEGQSIVQPLLNKLGQTNEDATIANIVYVFKVMGTPPLNSYDVPHDPAVMKELRAKVDGMREGYWKTRSEKNLKQLSAFQDGSSRPLPHG